jgi:hypothetical protein
VITVVKLRVHDVREVLISCIIFKCSRKILTVELVIFLKLNKDFC